MLVETLSMSDPDIWVEVNRVKDRHKGQVRVKWHPGHPEKRKARDGSVWDMHDRAVYRADEIVEDAHGVRQPKGASKLRKGRWKVLWRKQPLQGKTGSTYNYGSGKRSRLSFCRCIYRSHRWRQCWSGWSLRQQGG